MQLNCACGKVLKVPEGMAGKNGKCPACGKVFTVPAARGRVSQEAPALADGPLEIDPGPAAADGVEEYGTASVHCPSCNAEMAPAAVMCVHCGNHLTTGERVDQAEPQGASESARKKRKTAIIIAVVVGGCLLLAGASALALWKFGDNLREMLGLAAKEDDQDEKGAAKEPDKKDGDESGSSSSGIWAVDHATNLIRLKNKASDDLMKATMQSNIRAFEAEHGRLPKDLGELAKAYPGLRKLSPGRKFVYDVRTGRIDIVEVEEQSTPAGNP